MENNLNKPTFGSLANNNQDLTALVEKRASRPELGAAWLKTSKAGMNYYTFRLNFTKEKLQELLNSCTEGKISVDFVAFPNKTNNSNPKRPALRIYQELV